MILKRNKLKQFLIRIQDIFALKKLTLNSFSTDLLFPFEVSPKVQFVTQCETPIFKFTALLWHDKIRI